VKPARAQLALPGLEPPAKPRALSLLYWEAACGYWGPIAERLASECDLGPEGLTEEHLDGIPEFATMDEYRARLIETGVPFREG
jgi:hypothetical protein